MAREVRAILDCLDGQMLRKLCELRELPVLEAAHIRPYANGGEHAVANGLSLRSDIHRLFDKGYVAIDRDHKFLVGDRLKQDFENGRSYYGLRGQVVSLPRDPALQPSATALEWHREQIFLG